MVKKKGVASQGEQEVVVGGCRDAHDACREIFPETCMGSVQLHSSSA